MPDLNCYDVEAAMKVVAGTARNMGIAIKGVNDQELAEQEAEAIIEEKEQAEREAELAEMEAEAQAGAENKEVPTVAEEEDKEENEEAQEEAV